MFDVLVHLYGLAAVALVQVTLVAHKINIVGIVGIVDSHRIISYLNVKHARSVHGQQLLLDLLPLSRQPHFEEPLPQHHSDGILPGDLLVAAENFSNLLLGYLVDLLLPFRFAFGLLPPDCFEYFDVPFHLPLLICEGLDVLLGTTWLTVLLVSPASGW